MAPRNTAGSEQKLSGLERMILFSVTGAVFICATLGMWTVNLLSLDSLLGMPYNWPWYVSRSTALVAYLLLTGSVVWGLILSTKIVKEVTPPPLAMSIHNFISWLALTFAGLHAYLLLFDRYYTYRLRDLAIPFIGPYKPLAVGLGVGAFWVFLAASASFSVKKQIGQGLWRAIHIMTFPAFGLLTLHGMLAGTDSSNPGMLLVYAICGGLVVLLTLFRVFSLEPRTRSVRAS
jgi:hypothetical protein